MGFWKIQFSRKNLIFTKIRFSIWSPSIYEPRFVWERESEIRLYIFKIKEQNFDKIVIFVDQVVDSKGETLINVGNNTEFELYHSYPDEVIKGNVKDIEKIAKALNALIDEENIYYLNEKCTNLRSEQTSTIGL